jgi:CO/xanthine dehydrogenase Mo-binding subunit
LKKIEKMNRPSRRTLLRCGGALVVSIGAPMPFDLACAAEEAWLVGARPPLTPDQLSSYIGVNGDGTVSVFSGKTDLGQGLEVALAQMVAEELDVPFKAVKVVTGDTASSVNQGGASSASGGSEGGKQLRAAADEARRVLVELAAEKLGVPAEKLAVNGNRRCRSAASARGVGWRHKRVTHPTAAARRRLLFCTQCRPLRDRVRVRCAGAPRP